MCPHFLFKEMIFTAPHKKQSKKAINHFFVVKSQMFIKVSGSW